MAAFETEGMCMSAPDNADNLSAKSVPELIKNLWDLYFFMSLDPALESAAEHVREAALTLEHTRKLAFEIYRESCHQEAGTSKAELQEEDKEADAAAWLHVTKTVSQLKH